MDTEKSLRYYGWVICSTFPASLIIVAFRALSRGEVGIQDKT